MDKDSVLKYIAGDIKQPDPSLWGLVMDDLPGLEPRRELCRDETDYLRKSDRYAVLVLSDKVKRFSHSVSLWIEKCFKLSHTLDELPQDTIKNAFVRLKLNQLISLDSNSFKLYLIILFGPGYTSLRDMATELTVSYSTIRRGLAKLQSMNLLDKDFRPILGGVL